MADELEHDITDVVILSATYCLGSGMCSAVPHGAARSVSAVIEISVFHFCDATRHRA